MPKPSRRRTRRTCRARAPSIRILESFGLAEHPTCGDRYVPTNRGAVMLRGSAEATLLLRRCTVFVACAAPLIACTAPDVSAPLPARIGRTSSELATDFAVLPAVGTA